MVENKILIAIPCVDTIPVYNIECLLNLIKPCECNIRFGVNSGLVYIARDEACSIAINGGYTHVLFVDSDMAYEQKALEKALAHDDDVVTGLYFRRKGNHEPVLYRAIDQRRYDENGKIKYHGFAEVETDIERDYFPVAGCGFGFLLVKTDVLKRMQKEVYTSYKEKDIIVNAISQEGLVTFKVRGAEAPNSPFIWLKNPLTVAEVSWVENVRYRHQILKEATLVFSPILETTMQNMTNIAFVLEIINSMFQEEEKHLLFDDILEYLMACKGLKDYSLGSSFAGSSASAAFSSASLASSFFAGAFAFLVAGFFFGSSFAGSSAFTSLLST